MKKNKLPTEVLRPYCFLGDVQKYFQLFRIRRLDPFEQGELDKINNYRNENSSYGKSLTVILEYIDRQKIDPGRHNSVSNKFICIFTQAYCNYVNLVNNQ